MKVSQRKLGAILSYVSIIASTLVQLLYTPFLVGKLGQSEYGLYSLVSSMIGYLTVLDLGFGNAIVVHTAKFRAIGEVKKEQILHGMFKIVYIIIGIVAAIIGVIVALNSENIFSSTMTTEETQKIRIMLIILAFNLFMTFSFSIYSSIITANEQFVFQKILAIINTIAKPLLMIPLLFLGYKSIALCLVITVVNVAILIANYVFCKKKLKVKVKFQGFDRKLFKVIIGYSFWIFLTQIVDQINWGADQFILGVVSGAIAVSIYSAAAILNTMFISLATAISSVMLPKMSKMVATGASKKELSDEFIKVGRVQFIVVFLVASGIVLVGQEFIKVWLGNGFDEAYTVVLFLILPAMLSLIQNTGLSIIQAMNKFKFRALATFGMSIINIVISIFLAKKFGATGAAFGTGLSIMIVNVVVMSIYYKKVIKLDIIRFWKNIVVMFLKFLIPVGIILVIMAITRLEGRAALLTYGFIYVIIYAIATYLIVMNKYEKGMVDSFLKKIHLKRR